MVKHIELENSQKKVLRGYLHHPNDAKTIVVMFHGFTGNKTEHNGHFRNIARRLYEKNVASLRLDFYGNGESDGDFSDFDFETMIADAKIILDFAKSQPNIEKVVLLGFSMGGAVASIVGNDNNCDKIILISPAGNIKEIITNCFNNWQKLDNGNAYVNGFEMNHKLVTTVNKFDLFENATKYNKPVLIIQGTKDLSVDPKFSKIYFEQYKNAQLELIDGAGHGYDSYYQKEKMYEFVEKFINN